MFVLPALLAFGFLVIYPVGTAIDLSLRDSSLLTAAERAAFVGLDNFRDLVTSSDFWAALRITVFYTGLSVVGAFGLGLGLALLLNEKILARSVVRTLIFSPWVLPQVVGAFIWILIFNPQYGILNTSLERVGMLTQASSLAWLSDTSLALIAVSIVTVWRFFPIAMLMLLAALQSVDEALHESAKVDGASRIRRLWHVTLPSIRPVSTLLLLLLTVWIFRHFGTVYAMTQGGPAGATETITVKTYVEAFSNYDLGLASSYGVISLLISIAFSAVFLYVTVYRPRRKDA